MLNGFLELRIIDNLLVEQKRVWAKLCWRLSGV